MARKPAPRRGKREGKKTLAAQLARVKRITGDASIKLGTPDEVYLLRLGVIMELHIERWRAKVALSPEDLGLPPAKNPEEQAAFDELIVLGSKRLMPKWFYERTQSIESSARNFLDSPDASYETKYGRFVDVGRYPRVRGKLELYQQEYRAIPKRIESEEGAIEAWRHAQFSVQATKAYHQLAKLNSQSLNDHNGRRIAEKDFVCAYVSRIEERVPTIEQIIKSFDFRIDCSYIPMPSLLAKEHAEKERIEAKRALERLGEQRRVDLLNARTDAEHQRIAAKATLQKIKSRKKGEGLLEAQTDWLLLENAQKVDLNNRAKSLDAMHADVVGSTPNAKQVAADFTHAIQVQSIEIVSARMASALTSIQKNKALVGRVADQLRNAIDTYQVSKLVENTSVDGQIDELRRLLSAKPENRSLSQVQSLVTAIVAATKITLKGLR